MNDDKRKEVVTQLEQLRKEVETHARDASLLSHVDSLKTLVVDGAADRAHAQSSARGLEQKLLAWEAEHPMLVSLVGRIVHALEDAGI